MKPEKVPRPLPVIMRDPTKKPSPPSQPLNAAPCIDTHEYPILIKILAGSVEIHTLDLKHRTRIGVGDYPARLISDDFEKVPKLFMRYPLKDGTAEYGLTLASWRMHTRRDNQSALVRIEGLDEEPTAPTQ